MDSSDKTPSSQWEVLSRNQAARMIAGRLVLDREIELSEGNGRYTYIHCTNLNGIYSFRVAGSSLLDDIEDREIGGLGIFLVKKTMDELSYEYVDGQNILTMKKELA